jgi:phosphonate degradation associated HDIG domain protein
MTVKPAQLQSDDIITFILDLFARQGAREYMGEAVSMAQHMEQSAACAAADGAGDELVIAALLHDLGHFLCDHPIEALEQGRDNYHEEAGAIYLERYFPPGVTEPIRLHVAAKRYLCATDPAYLKQLSDASIGSLRVQGGPMDRDEVRQFEARPFYREAVKLRLYDDDGKVAGLTIKPVNEYRETMAALLIQSQRDS